MMSGYQKVQDTTNPSAALKQSEVNLRVSEAFHLPANRNGLFKFQQHISHVLGSSNWCAKNSKPSSIHRNLPEVL